LNMGLWCRSQREALFIIVGIVPQTASNCSLFMKDIPFCL